MDNKELALREYLEDTNYFKKNHKKYEMNFKYLNNGVKIYKVDDSNFETEFGDFVVLDENELLNYRVDEETKIVNQLNFEDYDNIYEYEDYLDYDYYERIAQNNIGDYFDSEIYTIDYDEDDEDNEFENDAVEFCYNEGIISDSDFDEDEDGNVDYKKCDYDIDDIRDMYIEYILDYEYDGNAIVYYIREIGSDEFISDVEDILYTKVQDDISGQNCEYMGMNVKYITDIDDVRYYIYRTN